MSQIKGCINSNCKAYHKITYKEKDKHCLLCGQPLVVVCKHKGCFKQLPYGDKSKYCAFHEAQNQERKEKAVDTAKKIGTGVVAVAGFAVTVGKTAIDIVRKR